MFFRDWRELGCFEFEGYRNGIALGCAES